MKPLFLLFAITALLIFTGCEKDLYDEAVVAESKATSEKVSVNQLLSEINNPIIKNYIKNELPHQLGLSESRTTGQQYLEFLKIVKTNGDITYSFLTHIYSDEERYTQYFVITKDGSTEKAGYAKYIPDSPITHFDVLDFSGRIQVLDIENNVAAETQFINSIPQAPDPNNNQGVTCTNSLQLIAHSCGDVGNHSPGQACDDGVIRSYWEVVTVVTCQGGNVIHYLAAPSTFMGGGGGGGSLSFDSDVMAFLNWLEDDQVEIVVDNPYLITYMEDNILTQQVKDMIVEIIEVCRELQEEEVADREEIIKVLIYAISNDYYQQGIDDNLFTAVDQDSSVNFTDPNQALNFVRLFAAHCAEINRQHPNWSYWKVFGQAWLDTTHLVLDLAGLVPAFGEFADLTNGVIYSIEGDGVNATLSFASTIPIAGWFSAGIKFAKRADGLKYVVIGANNLINFGAANSKKFRQVCGIAVGDATKQAHHILPRATAITNHPVVQKAAQAIGNQGFHIDQATNGMAVATARNQPNHPSYNNLIKSKLDDFMATHPNATPTQCYNELMDIINDAKNAIINNPNVHLNNITF